MLLHFYAGPIKSPALGAHFNSAFLLNYHITARAKKLITGSRFSFWFDHNNKNIIASEWVPVQSPLANNSVICYTIVRLCSCITIVITMSTLIHFEDLSLGPHLREGEAGAGEAAQGTPLLSWNYWNSQPHLTVNKMWWGLFTFIREHHMFHGPEVLHGLVHLGDLGPVQPVVARLQPLAVVVSQVVKIPGARLELRFCANCEQFWLELQMIHRFSQSWPMPLLGPSPGWKLLLALSHLRHY